jgi:hypothetical protein
MSCRPYGAKIICALQRRAAVRAIPRLRHPVEMIIMAPDTGLLGVITALRREFPQRDPAELERFAGAAWAAFASVSDDTHGRVQATEWYARALIQMDAAASAAS